MPGVAHRDRDHVRLRVRLDDDRDAAKLGELDGVAGEIEQHLAQPRRIADHARRQALVDIAADFEALGLRTRSEQFDRLFDKGRKPAKGRASRSSRPASILARSSISSMNDNSVSPEVFMALQIGRLLRRQRRVAGADRPCRGCR